MGLEYVKCDEWSLFPNVKGPRPLEDSVEFENSKAKISANDKQSTRDMSNEPEIQYNNNAILSIDGERYKA